MNEIETDYLVVGAGTAGMAFTDALIADRYADVVMVERRHRPGWSTAAEICDYYQRVLDEQLLASGRIRFFGTSEWSGGHRFESRLTGDETTVRVRRRVVDARYLEPSIPATRDPSYDAESGVRLIPGQRSRPAGRPGQRVHGHRRRQDRDRRVPGSPSNPNCRRPQP